MRLSSEKEPMAPFPDGEEDFENCKGQCGYTRWCKACMEEKKRLIEAAQRREAENADDKYA